MTAESKELLERHTALCLALTASLHQAIAAISHSQLDEFRQQLGVQDACLRDMREIEARIGKDSDASGLTRAQFLRHPLLATAATVHEKALRQTAAANEVYRHVVKKSLVTCSALLHLTKQALLEVGANGRKLEVHV